MPRVPSEAYGPHYGLDDPWVLQRVPRIERTSGHSCAHRTNHTGPLGSHFSADDLPGYGPTAGWPLPTRSRGFTAGASGGSDDDPHSTEDLFGRDRRRTSSVATARGGHGEPVAAIVEGDLTHSVP